MRTVRKPQLDVGVIFTACVNGYGYKPTKDRRERLTAVKPVIEQSAQRYDALAQSITLHMIPQAKLVSNGGVSVTKKEMEDLYDDKLAHAGASGRQHYDTIKAGARICPLCGQRTVGTIDHYLPKTLYPDLAVTPANLIPSCTDCNVTKKSYFPSSSAEHTLHPYYDDFTKEQWLYAEVIVGNSPSLVFSVNPPRGWDRVKTERATRHLDTFRLRELYGIHAGSLLSGIRLSLQREHRTNGTVGIHKYLQDAAESQEAAHINSWQAATYRGLDRSDWFCATGFALIEC